MGTEDRRGQKDRGQETLLAQRQHAIETVLASGLRLPGVNRLTADAWAGKGALRQPEASRAATIGWPEMAKTALICFPNSSFASGGVP